MPCLQSSLLDRGYTLVLAISHQEGPNPLAPCDEMLEAVLERRCPHNKLVVAATTVIGSRHKKRTARRQKIMYASIGSYVRSAQHPGDQPVASAATLPDLAHCWPRRRVLHHRGGTSVIWTLTKPGSRFLATLRCHEHVAMLSPGSGAPLVIHTGHHENHLYILEVALFVAAIVTDDHGSSPGCHLMRRQGGKEMRLE